MACPLLERPLIVALLLGLAAGCAPAGAQGLGNGGSLQPMDNPPMPPPPDDEDGDAGMLNAMPPPPPPPARPDAGVAVGPDAATATTPPPGSLAAVLGAASRGDLVGAILGALGSSVADELRLHKAHDAALTQQRLTAAVALVAPWVLLLLTVTSNPGAAAAYRTPTGTLVVAGGLVATALGYVLAIRTARLARPPRLFG